MMDTSIDLMQYAAVGGVIGILISLIPVAIYLAGAAKRDAKREAKRERKLKKKEAKKAKKMGDKVVSEENQEPQELRKVHREAPPVKQEEVKEPLMEELKPSLEKMPQVEVQNQECNRDTYFAHTGCHIFSRCCKT